MATDNFAFMFILIYFVLPLVALYLGYKFLGIKGIIGLIIVFTILPSMIFVNQSSQNNTEEEVPK